MLHQQKDSIDEA
jgi:hypothetical protein